LIGIRRHRAVVGAVRSIAIIRIHFKGVNYTITP
jgi:hypothetical protein